VAKTQIDQLYKQVAALTAGIKQEFRAKGIVIPVRGINGGVRLDDYTVTKVADHTYTITDSAGDILFQRINLSYSAILLANDLALGKPADRHVLENDKVYGYSTFEEAHYKKMTVSLANKQEWDRSELMSHKQKIAELKAKNAKSAVLASFEKIRRLR
jgi:hypothetical protein